VRRRRHWRRPRKSLPARSAPGWEDSDAAVEDSEEDEEGASDDDDDNDD